jgi:glutamine amidotransferase
MLGVVDLGISNIGSVLHAFRRLGCEASLVRTPDDLTGATAIVLPGVGAFADGMQALRRSGLVEPLKTTVSQGTPLLGFCLGMQLLADQSEEFGLHEGLGLVPGHVVRLAANGPDRVPNIGWCDVMPVSGSRLFNSPLLATAYYFVHSYQLVCFDTSDASASISFSGQYVTAAVERGNVFGFQFHPEKSQDAGLALLDNFLSIALAGDKR